MNCLAVLICSWIGISHMSWFNKVGCNANDNSDPCRQRVDPNLKNVWVTYVSAQCGVRDCALIVLVGYMWCNFLHFTGLRHWHRGRPEPNTPNRKMCGYFFGFLALLKKNVFGRWNSHVGTVHIRLAAVSLSVTNIGYLTNCLQVCQTPGGCAANG